MVTQKVEHGRNGSKHGIAFHHINSILSVDIGLHGVRSQGTMGLAEVKHTPEHISIALRLYARNSKKQRHKQYSQSTFLHLLLNVFHGFLLYTEH